MGKFKFSDFKQKLARFRIIIYISFLLFLFLFALLHTALARNNFSKMVDAFLCLSQLIAFFLFLFIFFMIFFEDLVFLFTNKNKKYRGLNIFLGIVLCLMLFLLFLFILLPGLPIPPFAALHPIDPKGGLLLRSKSIFGGVKGCFAILMPKKPEIPEI